jgi:hypothetical protein
MRISHRIELILLEERRIHVQELSRRCRITRSRCIEELSLLAPLGIETDDDEIVSIKPAATVN